MKNFDTGGQKRPDAYYSPNLLGGSIEYDVDLGGAGCSCNVAFYLVSAPGRDVNGNFAGSANGDYYCDANNVGGVWCPEMDIMEANIYNWRTTPHICDAPNSKGHYGNCDRGGCGKGLHEIDPHSYGPGSNYRINTWNPFHTKIEFHKASNRMDKIILTLSQGSNSVQLVVADQDCAYGYLDKMKTSIEQGMTLWITNWGDSYDTMKWLDGGLCSGGCNGNYSSKVSNITFRTGGSSPSPPSPPTPPSPSPSQYTYGDACASMSNCPGGCRTSCNWSWPTNDPQ